MTNRRILITKDNVVAPETVTELRESAEFREFLISKRTAITREIDDLDRDTAGANREQAARREKHDDLSFVLAQVDAALAIEPLPSAQPIAAPVIVEHVVVSEND